MIPFTPTLYGDFCSNLFSDIFLVNVGDRMEFDGAVGVGFPSYVKTRHL